MYPPIEKKFPAVGNPQLKSNLVTLQGKGEGISSSVTVNLQPYIDCYNIEGASGTHFKEYRDHLADQVSGLSGALFWYNALQCAMDNANITTEERRVIENSPACQYMKCGFVEILKNVMDEAILGHYQNGNMSQLELVLDIYLSGSGEVVLTLADNGRGFPPSFLEKNATPEGKDGYIRENCGSSKPSDKSMPPLFGGAGLGLRILIAQTLYGDELASPGVLKPQYEKPPVSEIVLKNKSVDSGAVIQIRTSLEPLKEKVMEVKATNDVPILKLPPRRKPPGAPVTATIGAQDMKKAIQELRSPVSEEKLDNPQNLGN